MTGDDKDLHQDIGSLKEFKEWAKGEFNEVHRKLDEVVSFRWQIIGGSIAVSSILSILMSLGIALWKTKG